MIALAASVVLAASPAPAVTEYRPQRCRTRSCHRRVVRRYKRRVIAPYRGWLRRVRFCESGSHGLYRANTGNGFYGAYQFTISSWRAVGGRGWPHRARPLEQDYRAVRLLHLQGRGAWPVCG